CQQPRPAGMASGSPTGTSTSYQAARNREPRIDVRKQPMPRTFELAPPIFQVRVERGPPARMPRRPRETKPKPENCKRSDSCYAQKMKDKLSSLPNAYHATIRLTKKGGRSPPNLPVLFRARASQLLP